LGNLATPKSVQKLQTALHAKAKAEAGYRFYALYDKISRDDILAHAYAQCRSNKGAPGIDGQDFADIEAYGVERWLAELALALRQETYRPEPIRRVFIPKANGKRRPLGISSSHGPTYCGISSTPRIALSGIAKSGTASAK
jgi:RNA-directed DNA polymerase